MQHVAERVWPAGAGYSCRAVTLPIDPELERKLLAIAFRCGWWGMAQFQMLVPADGRPRVIDFNGRIYASLESSRAAGLNLPVTWADLALGRPTSPRVEGAPDVRYQWLEGDLRRALRERRGGLVADVADCIRAAPKAHHAVWRRDDPVPAGWSIVHELGSAARRAGRRRRSPWN